MNWFIFGVLWLVGAFITRCWAKGYFTAWYPEWSWGYELIVDTLALIGNIPAFALFVFLVASHPECRFRFKL